MGSTSTRTRKTALLASGLEVHTAWCAPSGLSAAGDSSVLVASPAPRDAAVLAFEMAVVLPVVNDHTSSTRLGSPSCSPPV